MSDWKTARLGDLCSRVTSGGTPLRSIREYYEGGTIPWLKTGEVKKGYVWEAEEFITERGLEESSAKLIPANSLIVAMYGDGNTAGNVAINKVPLATNQACCNFTLNPRLADYRYVYHYLKGSYSNLVGLKLGGSQQNLNAATLKAFPINVPSLETQQKIASILSAYDNLIANNQRRITLLERMAEDIYREWFVRLRFPGHEDVKIERGVPKGWDVSPFSKVVNINPRERINASAQIPFVPMDELSTSQMYFNVNEYRQHAAGSKFRNNDVLLPRITPSLENGKRGYVLTLPNETVGVGSTEFIVLREQRLSSEHIYFLTCSSEFRKHAELSMTGASGRQRVSEDCFGFLLVKVPPHDLRNRFKDTVSPYFQQVRVLNESLNKLKATRDALLPRLISGKLSVDSLDIRVPPGMLEAG